MTLEPLKELPIPKAPINDIKNDDILANYCNGSVSATELVSKISSLIEEDYKKARIYAQVMAKLITSENTNSKIIPTLLCHLQEQYKKLMLNSSSISVEERQAIVSMLCAYFEFIRAPQGQAILAPLATPIVQALETLAKCENSPSGSEEQFEKVKSLLHHLQVIGKELDQLAVKPVDKLFISIRNSFMKKSTKEKTRLMMMELLEVRASKWSISESAYEFYYGNKTDSS